MSNVYNILKERKFVEQVTDEALIEEKLSQEKVSCYIGFDPTARSLHIGSLVPIMAMMHMQRHFHRPIALVGGGTALIGDPSGKTEMRQLLGTEQINSNASALQKQLSRYLDFSDGKAIMLNNADWLTQIKYIDFLRDIGKHFSVNKMLTAETYRQRMEKGLNFIEFNYMLLQAFDFLHLFQNNDCLLQMGGNDQWGNILAGTDLIRRVTGKNAFGVTFPLLVTANGHKMGKTEKGAIWLDAELTSPYEYYQYWVNIDDADLKKFLLLFTFLPTEEIKAIDKLRDSELNVAKSILAFETTKITHGEAMAISAWQASATAFGTKSVTASLLPSSSIPRGETTKDLSAIPSITKTLAQISEGIPAYKLFVETSLCGSASEARRLVAQSGGYINEHLVASFDEIININHVNPDKEIVLRKGKKSYGIVKIIG
ncbi:MAG: tyrosine--tRNA ligase [Deltaproteobacteria bacterium]